MTEEESPARMAPCQNPVETQDKTKVTPVGSLPGYSLLSNSVRCCRICLDDDAHGLYSPCRCRGSIKFVHSHCLTRWRKSLMAHGRDESANSCTMCGFNYVLKKRARFYELISFRGIRIAITVLMVLAMLVPAGYVMKVCVLLAGYNDNPASMPSQGWRGWSATMDDMSVFPICKADSKKATLLGLGSVKASIKTPKAFSLVTGPGQGSEGSSSQMSSSAVATAPSPSHFVSLFPGPYGPPNVNVMASSNSNSVPATASDDRSTSGSTGSRSRPLEEQRHNSRHDQSHSRPSQAGSWAWLAAGIDGVGSSQWASMLLYPFVNDRIWYFLLCRLQHLHLGFFLLGSASNVYMACKMLSDMYDLVITPPHSRYVKNLFLAQTSIFVIWFWFSYNLMAFRVSTTEEEFLSELPLWALRWINVGVAIVDLSYRRIYKRLGRLKVEEELLDIADVEKVEEMQQKAWMHQQQRFLQYSQEQGQYLLGQFKALEVKQSILNGANAAVDAVSDVYSKTSIPSFPPIPNSFASAVNLMSNSTGYTPALNADGVGRTTATFMTDPEETPCR